MQPCLHLVKRIPALGASGDTAWAEAPTSAPKASWTREWSEALPEGQFLVHNSVPPAHPLGSHGFRAWLQAQDEHLEPCDCGWTPELGTHYRVKLKILERDRAARATDFA